MSTPSGTVERILRTANDEDDHKYDNEVNGENEANLGNLGAQVTQANNGVKGVNNVNKGNVEEKENSNKSPIDGLPTVIDVGGQIFDFKSETNVSSGFYGSQTFYKTFNRSTYGDLPVEYLLRKYLPIHQTIKDIQFNPGDYEKLVQVLKHRARQLRETREYQSSIVKNIPIQRYYLRILEIIDELRQTHKEKKVIVPQLSEDEIFQILLEMGWYLAHPAEASEKMGEEWKIVLERLGKEGIGDFVKSIHDLERERGMVVEDEPLRYFKKLEMGEVLHAETIQQAMNQVKDMVLVEPKPISPGMRARFENVLRVLQAKGYIEQDNEQNEDGLPLVDTNRLEKDMMENPLARKQGGGNKKGKKKKGGSVAPSPLSVPLGQAILPLFRYFRMLYDPVYGMLEQASPRSVKRGIFPHLLILLHLCNEFQTPPTGKKMEYGLYHLRNIPSELVTFLTNQLKETEQFILSLPTMVEQAAFQKQLFQLPRVRLRTLLRNNGGLPTMTNEQHSIFHIQFFVVGVNLLPMEEGAFTKKNRNVDSKVGDTIRETWAPSQVFLSFTDAGTTTENIPFRFFEIDYEKVRVNESGITVGQYSGALDALRTDGPILQEKDAYVDRLAELKPFAVYNDAELALSTLMAIKEHMPK